MELDRGQQVQASVQLIQASFRKTERGGIEDGVGGVFVFRNRNRAAAWEVTLLDKHRAGLHWPNIIHLADINKDGHLDILATDWAHKAVAWIYQADRSIP